MSRDRGTEVWDRLISTDADVVRENGGRPAVAGERFTVPALVPEARYVLAAFDPVERTWLAVRMGGGMTPMTVWITHEMLNDRAAVTRL